MLLLLQPIKMDEEQTIHKRKITRKSKVPFLRGTDLIKNIPKTTITLINYFGEIILDSVELEVTKASQFNMLPGFYKKVLPLVIPLDEKKENNNSEEKIKKENSYLG